MNILPKAEAEGQPVGEGQEEPNVNPTLLKPNEGRGIGDKIMAVTNLDVGNIQLPRTNLWRNLLITGVVVVIIIVVLIIVMFLKP